MGNNVLLKFDMTDRTDDHVMLLPRDLHVQVDRNRAPSISCPHSTTSRLKGIP